MIDKQFWERYQIFIYLLIIIFGLLALKAKYGYKGENQITNNQLPITNLTPTPETSPIPTINQYPLSDKLPYYGKGFVVEKYTAPMTLQMILNGAKEPQAEKDVTNWLNSFGDAIGQHTVVIEEASPTARPTSIKTKVKPTISPTIN